MSKPLNLSGYLPGEKETNLHEHAGDLIATFEQQLREAHDAAVLVPVIGMLRVEAVKRSRGGEPSCEVRFAGLEVPEGSDVETIRTLWRQLRDKRVGEEPLDLEWDTTDAEYSEDTGAHPGASTVTPVEFSGSKKGRARG